MSVLTNFEARTSGREKYNFYNSLSILIKTVERQRTTVDLRNESSINGIVELSDGCVKRFFYPVKFYLIF